MPSSTLGRRFWAVWTAASATNLGDGITLTALPLLAVSLTDDELLVALVTVARFLPFVVLGLPLGLVVDRYDRRHVIVASQILRGGVMAVTAALAATGAATIGLLIVAGFFVGLGENLTDGATPALVRNVVDPDDLELANARQVSSQAVTNLLLGPPLGAALFVLADWLPFAVITATFAAGGAMLAALPGRYRPERSDDHGATTVRRVTLGLSYVWNHEVLRPLALTVAAFAFLNAAGEGIFVILATERFGLSEVGFGLLVSVDAGVALIVSLFVARLVRRIGHAGSLKVSIVCYAVSALLLGTGTHVAFAVIAAVLGGASNPTWNVVSSTLRQRLVPDHLFGRMMTAYLFIAWGMQPVGAFIGGVVADVWGAEWVYLASAPAMALVFLLGRPLFLAVTTSMTTPSGKDAHLEPS